MAYTGKKPIDVIDATTAQTLTIEDNIVTPSINGGQIGGRRNLIINGAMRVAQRGTSETGIGTADGFFTVDRFKVNVASSSVNAGRLTMTQESDAPSVTGLTKSVKFACTIADTSIGATEFFVFEQKIEGQDVQRLAKGTSDAKELTVSFYVKSSSNITFIAELLDETNSRTVSKSFNVTTDWTRVELTYPADTTGTIADNANSGLRLLIWMHAGSDFSGGSSLQTSWGAISNPDRAVGCGSIVDSTSRTFFITGVQMEVGTVATEFEHLSFAEDLALCKRYFHKLDTERTLYTADYGTNSFARLACPVTMRAVPTVTGTASDAVIATYHTKDMVQVYIDNNAQNFQSAEADAEM